MNIIFYQPPKHLAHFIRYFWSCDLVDSISDKVIYFENYADKHPRMVFQVEDKHLLKNNKNNYVPKAYVCGIETLPSSMSIQANFAHFGISFNPFGLTEIFKTANETMVNKTVDLVDLGYADLVKKLSDAKSHLHRIEIMCRFIEAQLSQKLVVNSAIIQIVLNEEIVEQANLVDLQKKYGFSERTLERQFKNAMGISPKTFQRLVRFEKTLTLLKNPAYSNSAVVGYMLDYTDQSHFIKDFKRFTNITPAKFQKNNFLLSESSAFISKL
jgi:AraC-like DNA-binding protein